MSDITVQFGTPNISVYFPVSTSSQHAPDWLDSLPICDSDNTSSGTGQSAEDAGVGVGEYYMTAFNHLEVAGGIPKKRVI